MKNNRYLILAGLIFGCALFAVSFNDIYSADAAFEKMTNTKIEYIAPIFNITPQELILEIKNNGISEVGAELTLNEVAKLNNVDIYDVIEPLWKIESK